MTNETLQTICSRRSCRAYKPQQITDAELDAVRWRPAPTLPAPWDARALRSWSCRMPLPAPS